MSYKWNHNFPKIAREAGFVIRDLSIGHCIDWRYIASLDPHLISSEKDYEKLDDFIPHIAQVSIGTLLTNRILDPAIGKYFILAQFSIQYLLFCKQFLDETVVEIRNTAQDAQKEHSRLEKICRRKNEELIVLNRKLQKAESLQAQTTVFPCSKCTKNFISSELLNAHVVRKHQDHFVMTNSTASIGGSELPAQTRKLSETDANLINTIKLELEVKQLKERLNAAEKDLMEQRNRDHRCHQCYNGQNIQPKSKKPPIEEVIFHSIAIQSNLEDVKDINEKEVQTSAKPETPPPNRLSPIPVRLTPSPNRRKRSPLLSSPSPQPDLVSKDEVEAIVREQFESWKAIERDKFNREIEQVRQNLAATIQELEKRESSAEAVVPPVAQAPVVTDRESENIWKLRYHELEQMYENSQRQVKETVESIESVYEEKFKQFERKLAQQEAVAKRERDQTAQAVERILIENKTSQNVGHSTTKNVEPIRKTPIVQIQPDHDDSDEGSHVESQRESSPSEHSESDDEIRALEKTKAKYLVTEAKDKLPKVEKLPISEVSIEKPVILPKQQILNTFKSRLKSLGIDSKTKSLPKEEFNAAAEALAGRRDANRKKNRNFFLTRNQILAKVDRIAKTKMGESVKNKPDQKRTTENAPIIKSKDSAALQPVPKLRTTFQVTEQKSPIEILPSKTKISTAPKPRQTTTNIFKTKSAASFQELRETNDDIITVQAEINPKAEILERSANVPRKASPQPTRTDYENHLDRLLETPVKRITPPPDIIEVATSDDQKRNDSDLSDILDTVPLKPKPIPKKRVLFDLDRGAGSNADQLGNKSSAIKEVTPILSTPTEAHSLRADEESDWNISSFDEDK
ncbi:cilium assembly protein DZIP1L [Uranotaenia lowii]|uniref:cilium assembly protein DZIP1L n=1 Tax=Uranotaenia lowii TaxID=190385 RepID=UPI002479DE08|nr:cilium assembly protein DZIP1L [Uranotaenia lowii]